jgi:hypothetical protein
VLVDSAQSAAIVGHVVVVCDEFFQRKTNLPFSRAMMQQHHPVFVVLRGFQEKIVSIRSVNDPAEPLANQGGFSNFVDIEVKNDFPNNFARYMLERIPLSPSFALHFDFSPTVRETHNLDCGVREPHIHISPNFY